MDTITKAAPKSSGLTIPGHAVLREVMRISLLILAVFAVLGSPAAEAQRRRKPVKTAPKASPQPPKPGTCETVPGAVRIRRCYPAGAVGHFTAKVTGGRTLLIEFDEKVLDILRPDSRYFAARRLTGRSFTLQPLRRSWPDYVVAVFKTQTMSVTLEFKPVKTAAADVQLHILRLDRRNNDADVERRVASHKALLNARHKAQLAGLHKRAAKLAREQILDWVNQGGVHIRTAGGKKWVRKNFVRIRSGKRVRIHNQYFVYFRIDNRDWSARTLALPVVKLSRGGTHTPIRGALLRCGKLFLPAGSAVTCVASFTLGRHLEQGERFVVSVHNSRGDHLVTLRNMDIR